MQYGSVGKHRDIDKTTAENPVFCDDKKADKIPKYLHQVSMIIGASNAMGIC